MGKALGPSTALGSSDVKGSSGGRLAEGGGCGSESDRWRMRIGGRIDRWASCRSCGRMRGDVDQQSGVLDQPSGVLERRSLGVETSGAKEADRESTGRSVGRGDADLSIRVSCGRIPAGKACGRRYRFVGGGEASQQQEGRMLDGCTRRVCRRSMDPGQLLQFKLNYRIFQFSNEK